MGCSWGLRCCCSSLLLKVTEAPHLRDALGNGSHNSLPGPLPRQSKDLLRSAQAVAISCSPSFSTMALRSRNFWILPVMVIGKASTNSM